MNTKLINIKSIRPLNIPKPSMGQALSQVDMQQQIKMFFDELEENGDKQTQGILYNKLNSLVNDQDGAYQKQNLEYIENLDKRTKSIK